MTASPRLPGSVVRRAARPGNGATEAELTHVAELARRRDARTIVLGRGPYAGRPALPRPACFPGPVPVRAADGARTVPRGDRGGLVGEEDAVPHVAAGCDGAQRGGAVEAAVDPQAAVTAPPALRVRL